VFFDLLESLEKKDSPVKTNAAQSAAKADNPKPISAPKEVQTATKIVPAGIISKGIKRRKPKISALCFFRSIETSLKFPFAIKPNPGMMASNTTKDPENHSGRRLPKAIRMPKILQKAAVPYLFLFCRSLKEKNPFTRR